MSSQKMSNEQLVLRIKAGENVADNMLRSSGSRTKSLFRLWRKKYAAYEEIERI